MPGKNLPNICGSVMNFFNKTVSQVDKAAKFVKRKSKVNAQLFVEALVAGCLSDPTISLERLCRLMKERGVKITKQGLHQRFNSEATLLMKNLMMESLNQFKAERNDVLCLLKPFSSVKLQDSSAIMLPSKLKGVFRGCGGGASEASLKIQVMFDYVEGQVSEISFTEGCRSDQGFDGHLERIEKGALYLQDLGYFKLKFFERVRSKEAYFISRYSYPTKMFNGDDELLDLLQELRKADTFFAKKVWLGKEKIEVRLMAFRLSDEEVEKRLRKKKEKARKNGRGLTQETLELAKWSIYIANVPESMLNDEQVHLLYTLRWQIELLFKLCKSEAGLDKVRGKKPDRILCELYAKLICTVILLYFCFPVRWKEHRELSLYKAYVALKLKGADLFRALKSTYRLIGFIKTFLSDLEDFSCKDRYRKKRRLTYQKMMDATGQKVLI